MSESYSQYFIVLVQKYNEIVDCPIQCKKSKKKYKNVPI